jgi:hypothetical protein
MRAPWLLGLAIGAIACGRSAPATGDEPSAKPAKLPRPLFVQLAPSRGDAPFDDSLVRAIAARPEVAAVAPAAALAIPARGRAVLSGNELHLEVGPFTDGIDPAYVAADLGTVFRDFDDGGAPAAHPACTPGAATGCDAASYCDELDRACRHRVPVIVSPATLDRYNRDLAPTHDLAPIADPRSLIASGGTRFDLTLGASMQAGGAAAPPHRIGAVVVGVHPAATTLGMTVPISYVLRWRAEYHETNAPPYARISVRLRDQDRLAVFTAWAHARGLDVDRAPSAP